VAPFQNPLTWSLYVVLVHVNSTYAWSLLFSLTACFVAVSEKPVLKPPMAELVAAGTELLTSTHSGTPDDTCDRYFLVDVLLLVT
jgi:hypothetical protein